MKSVYTTAEAAAICGVSSRMIARAFDRGDLLGFVIPFSRHHRLVDLQCRTAGNVSHSEIDQT